MEFYIHRLQVINQSPCGYFTYNIVWYKKGPQWPSGYQVWHLIKGCHLCMDSTLPGGSGVGLTQYDPGC